MLQTRPSTSAGIMTPSQSHVNHQYVGASSQPSRSPYHGSGSSGYRGSTAPVQPFAFASMPNFHQAMPWQQYGTGYRAGSSATPGAQVYEQNMSHRSPIPTSASATNLGYHPTPASNYVTSRDDSTLSAPRNMASTQRSQATLSIGTQPSFSSGVPSSNRNTPDRYRRPNGNAAHHGRSQSSTIPSSITIVNGNNFQSATGSPRYPANMGGGRGLYAVSSYDDMHLHRVSQEEARRLRRRSLHAVDAGDVIRQDATSTLRHSDKDTKSPRLAPAVATSHSRKLSSESAVSTRSSHSRPSSASRNTSVPTANSSTSTDEASAKNDHGRTVNIPPRASSTDAAKRTHSPSPLSKAATTANDAADDSTSPPLSSGSAAGKLDSPAAKHLAAINQKGCKSKNKTSRLRRAFSFGSAADFRKAAGGESDGTDKGESSKAYKEPLTEEAYESEQARIAEAQEAAGIGTSIYGGRFFGSTDNLSISSTASSASIMIRKMGRGMKKSTRSLVGLFRPKSILGAPSPEALAPEASQATVSMITVEAETQRVNVTADPSAANGGTGFPHLERNSLDASRVPDMVQGGVSPTGTDQAASRKSIMGGDRERAEVLAAVRKGILKRSSSPSVRPTESSPDLVLPNIPAIADSPSSSAPSTPNDENQGHKRTGSIAIGNEDYFMSALRLRQDTRSPPGTPQGLGKRSATFSPRIVFHDTWPSQEYDRRGDVATCNRLTPMLAQQIKEELNTFKMEMEVHENSKIYTHFF
ncbi:hypothetical protein CDD82_4386 [Ophiocordyceps australis]|uniref:Protein BNI4 n=1 Tax=Ophiocordyceps australis TaxID=1399860 RepID=A0A2C5YBW4_9HYPO|nr:hypothetical protein CDD82_4386 [Ophiocordyceps australis]